MRIGIDLGGTKTEGVVVGEDAGVLARQRIATPAASGYEAIVATVVDLARTLERQAGVPCRIGVGTPGSVDRARGVMKNCNTTALNDRPLPADLAASLGRPVRIANDANCFALAEATEGAGQGAGVVFGVILGTGVGGGIAFHGHVHEGSQGIAGEWGHNPLEPDGPACYCGRRGCVETLLSGPGLLRDYRNGGGSACVDSHEVVTRSRDGEPAARAAMARYVARFGRAMATVINILDPDAIVLGGGLSAIDELYDAGAREVIRHVFNNDPRTVIRRNRLGDSAGVLGAAALWPPQDLAGGGHQLDGSISGPTDRDRTP